MQGYYQRKNELWAVPQYDVERKLLLNCSSRPALCWLLLTHCTVPYLEKQNHTEKRRKIRHVELITMCRRQCVGSLTSAVSLCRGGYSAIMGERFLLYAPTSLARNLPRYWMAIEAPFSLRCHSLTIAFTIAADIDVILCCWLHASWPNSWKQQLFILAYQRRL